MASNIRIASEIDTSKIEFGAVKVLNSGAKSVPLRYEGRNLMVETPTLTIPYGVNKFDKTQGAVPKFSVDMSLGGADDNKEIAALKEFFEAFDQRMIQAGMENSNAWFKMAKPNETVIDAFYTRIMKISRDESGNPKPYPPTFKAALRKRIIRKPGDKEGVQDLGETVSAFDTKFYNAAKEIEEFAGDLKIEDVLPKRAQISIIMECTGVWFAGGKFGTTWRAFQVLVHDKPEQIRGPAFRSFATDAPDIKAFAARLTAAAPAPSGGAGDDDDSYGGYGGGSTGGGSALDAVMPKKAAAAPAPAPAVEETPVVAPAYDEEQVTEPVAVPASKKVVKKIVKKTT
jgi:hypothetical protein